MLRVALAWVVASSTVSAQPFIRTRADSGSGETDVCVTWGERRVVYRMDAAGSARTPVESEFTAIDSAFSAWQSVSRTCSDFEFVRGARITGAKAGRGTDADNIVVFREENCRDVVPPGDACEADGSCGNRYNCWEGGEATIALTTSTYSRRTGVIVDSDIEFNAGKSFDGTRFLFTTISSPSCTEGNESVFCAAFDVQNTATHEIGHLVGLDHVGTMGATMAPEATLGDLSKRVIDPGTAAGFCSTYPKGKPPVPCDDLAQLKNQITARNTGTLGCSCDAGGGLSGLWVFALWASRRRARGA